MKTSSWRIGRLLLLPLLFLTGVSSLQAGEADIKIPDLSAVSFNVLGTQASGHLLLYIGLIVSVLGMLYGW